jgi:hypothetical protein
MSKFKLNEIVVWLDPEKVTSAVYRVQDVRKNIYFLKNNYSETFANESEIDTPNKILVCKTCGCFHVQIEAWVDINTDDVMGDVADARRWCEGCKDEVDVISAYEYHKLDIELLKAEK